MLAYSEIEIRHYKNTVIKGNKIMFTLQYTKAK